jgi:hypothetical protein
MASASNLLGTSSNAELKAENLFLQRLLVHFPKRKTKSRRADDATRPTLALLSTLFAWKEALVIVRPETELLWYRKDFQ